jgi:hypothetical protein
MYTRLFQKVTGLLLIFGIHSTLSYSQNEDPFLKTVEDSLITSYKAILNQNPFHRESSCEKFYTQFYSALQKENSFEYPFDSLNKIGKIYSPDKRLRVITWNIPVGLSDNVYYGIIQYYSKTEKSFKLIRLNDSINLGENSIRYPWNGTLYFEIIETKHAGQKYYTLLGFNFNTPLSNQKTIDVLSIDDFDKLYYCENLFNFEQKPLNRLVFEYNEKAVMALRYDEDKKMIVFDHLAPSRPSMKGKYEFYGPDFTYDGLKFEKGIWMHYSNIDITN